ncbi:hypothetical protein [Herbiconiux sp.]|uniref:hypothetical protein n=1 Tax=Herbiconiux sp. TaxID=1871186 RepID=UPI0025C0BE4D|nr:hypothetical protein [Herbiconiux sp.]
MTEWVSGEPMPEEMMTDAHDRLAYASREQDAFFRDVRLHFDAHAVTLECEVGALGVTSTVRARVSGKVIPDDWKHRLGNILNDYRSALDSFAWTLANVVRAEPMPEREAKRVYFPLASTKEEWDREVRKKGSWLSQLPVGLIDRLRRVQPFLLPNPDNSILMWLHLTDNLRKHRWSLSLRAVLDPQMPHIFQSVSSGGRVMQIGGDHDKLRANVGEAIADQQIVYQLALPQQSVKVYSDHQAFLALWVSRDGYGVDLQDFLYAVNLKVQWTIKTVLGMSAELPKKSLRQLRSYPGPKDLWNQHLDDSGRVASLGVLTSGGEIETFSFTVRNDDDLLAALNKQVRKWESTHGQQFPSSGEPGLVQSVTAHYPGEDHQPIDGTVPVRLNRYDTFYDMCVLFGHDIFETEPMVVLEFNTGKGESRQNEVFSRSIDTILMIHRDYGRLPEGLDGIRTLSQRVLTAPVASAKTYSTTRHIDSYLSEFVRSMNLWDPSDLSRMLQIEEEDAVGLLSSERFEKHEGDHIIYSQSAVSDDK